MVDLNEFVGADALRKSLEKKRAKAQEKLNKINEKAIPVAKEIAMYNDMLNAMDMREDPKVEVFMANGKASFGMPEDND